jgi:hypothetical protein
MRWGAVQAKPKYVHALLIGYHRGCPRKTVGRSPRSVEDLRGTARRADRYDMETASGAHRDSQQMSHSVAPSALSPRSRATGPPLHWTGSPESLPGPPQLFVDPLVSGIAVNMVSMSALNMNSAEGQVGPRDFAQAISWKITTNGLVCSISGACVHTIHSCA